METFVDIWDGILWRYLLTLVEFLKNKWKGLKDNLKRCLDRERENTRSGAGNIKPK